jgi:hypothetical protein
MSQQWYPWLQNPQGLTFITIEFSEVGGQIGCKIGLGQNDKPLPFMHFNHLGGHCILHLFQTKCFFMNLNNIKI